MMIGRTLLAVLFLTVASSAQCAWDAGIGLEDHQWTEYPDGASGTPKENGLRSALFVGWTQDGDRGGLLAGRAKLYLGTVNYDTFLMSTGAPVSTKTDYIGGLGEVQAFYRDDVGGYAVDYLGGLGVDLWRRSISDSGGGDQVEDYSIPFLRAGLRLGKLRREAGLHGELGVKYPFAGRENAHLDRLGFTSNPTISPAGAVSGYAEMGYRINTRFDLVGYYDSWRFRRSPDVSANKPTDSPGAYWLIYQPKSRMDALGIKLLYSF